MSCVKGNNDNLDVLGQDDVKPLVSVIVPVYNVEKYLPRCLDSIVGQTYPNLEILLINDGSRDGSGEICRRYAQRDSRIRLFTQENQGMSVARNVGLDHMRGEYIVYVDSDDYISTSFVEILLGKQQETKASIVCCKWVEIQWDDDCADLQPKTLGSQRYKVISRDELFRMLAADKQPVWAYIWARIYHKDIFTNLRFPPGKAYEDLFLFSQILWQAESVCYMEPVLYAYRQSANSITRKNGTFCYPLEFIESFANQMSFAKQQGLEQYEMKLMKHMAFQIYTGNYSMKSGELKQYLREGEEIVYRVTGKRPSSLKYLWFRTTPGLFGLTRKLYLKVKHFAVILRSKNDCKERGKSFLKF